MDFQVLIRSGFYGNEHGLGQVRLRPRAVGNAAARFASTHILRMDEHYDSYIVNQNIPHMPVIHGIATAHPAIRMTAKQRATSVTGNIGEIAAPLTIRRKITGLRRIRHLDVARPYKTPDFHMRFNPMIPPQFQLVVPAGVVANFADWPMESKAAKTIKLEQRSQIRALCQLGHYWYYRGMHDMNVVGFGIVVSMVFEEVRRITIMVFTPSNQPALHGLIQQHGAANALPQLLDQLQTPNSPARQLIHHMV